MAAPPTGTFETYAAIGNREDLSDMIYDISPIDTPFLSSIPSVDATAVTHEWQTDALDAAAENKESEGEDATTDSATATTRLSNTCMISDKVPRVSGTQQAVNKAGRGDELEYQIYKRARELKRDVEVNLTQNNAEVSGSSGTDRELGGVPAWITTNLSKASDATAGGTGDTAYTTGTARAFTESLFKDVLDSCWDSGGDPDTVMLGKFNRRKFSAFTGNATREVGAEDKKLYASIDVYDSDWGELQVVPNRFMPGDFAFVLQTDMWAAAYLRPFQMHDLAKTGDSERRQLIVEMTLEARNEAASGMVGDLTTS